MKRIFPLFIAAAAAALVACDGSDTHSPTQAHHDAPESQIRPVGTVLKEFPVSGETTVRFHEYNGIVTLSMEGDVDEKESNKSLEDALLRARSMEEAYRLLDPDGQVPQAILDFDQLPKTESPETEPPVAAASGAGSQTPEAEAPLAKSANHAVPSSDAWWDWNGDAEWWRGVVGYTCGWHAAATYTNVTWADDWRQGWYSRGYLMAASHTYGANAYAYVWSNGAWVLTNSTYLQPRHYIVWYSGDTQKRYRRYAVYGLGGAYARIHWGMRWDTQAPSDIGVICQS